MSDTSQSILRVTVLGGMMAGFMALWSADSSATRGMLLAERNRRVVPAHALGRPDRALAASRRSIHEGADRSRVVQYGPAVGLGTQARPATVNADQLAGGTYRVIYADGRVEWMTVIDRAQQNETVEGTTVISTTVGGQPAWLIRVTSSAESQVR